MHRMRIGIIGLLVMAVAISTLAGCGRRGLIQVNDEKIAKEDFYAKLEAVPVQTPTGAKLAGQYVIEQMIQTQLIEQFAEEQKIAPTQEDVDKRFQRIKKDAGGDLARSLAAKGKSVESYKEQLKTQLAQFNIITQGVKVEDAEVKEVYDQALKADPSPLKRPEQIKASLIQTAEKEKIDKAYKMLKEGKEFGAVALTLSEHPTSKNEGQLPDWVGRNPKAEGVEKLFTEKLFSLGVNKYSEPFQAEGSWYILKAGQKRPPKTQTYDEVKDDIREQLALRKGLSDAKYRDKLQEFIKDSKIVVNAKRYEKIPENIKKEVQDAIERQAEQLKNKEVGSGGEVGE